MYTAPFNPAASSKLRGSWILLPLTLLLLASVFPAPALAKQSDRSQKINVGADHFESSQDTGITTLSGHVVITQGTLKATASKGTAHADASGRTERIVLDGKPAHLQQLMDDGSLMRAHANTIDYQVNGDTITLNGDAHVQQPGQGTFNGAHLVYNPSSGAIKGDGGNQGRVHLTLEPRKTD